MANKPLAEGQMPRKRAVNTAEVHVWRQVADKMAARLIYAECGDHPEPVGGCPFCADVAAYEAYLAAGGTVRRFVSSGKVIPMEEFYKIPLNDVAGES